MPSLYYRTFTDSLIINDVGIAYVLDEIIFMQCEPNCVDGTRTRTVWCQTVPEGVVVADIMCDCDLKPASSERCTNVPGLLECFDRPLWKTGEFSAVRTVYY